MKVESLKRKWIFWKWKDKSFKAFSKSYVQEIIKLNNGDLLLELSDNDSFTNYPTRIISKDIIIRTESL